MGDDNNNSPFVNHKNNYDMNSKIMLSAIISLSLVVILVLILHIYARCLIRSQARRESALRRLNFIISYHAAAIDPRIINTGLNPSIIPALPTHIYKKETAREDDIDQSQSYEMGFGNKECSVCLSMYEDGEMVRTLPNCKHSFHAECIDKWFGSNSTCPVCRMDAEPVTVVVVDATGAPPSAPSLEETSGSDGGGGGGVKVTSRSMSLRFSYSFRRMLSRERSSPRIQTQSPGDLEHGGVTDHERQ